MRIPDTNVISQYTLVLRIRLSFVQSLSLKIKMLRILEPELMTDVAQCQAYATANFGASNQRYVDIVGNLMPGIVSTVLDIGCGPGDVMIRLAKIRPELKITAIDGSQKMIQLASAAISSNGLDANIHAVEGYVPMLALPVGSYDVVLSKDFLHHLPEPMAFWHEIRRMIKPGGFICVMDLRRPDSTIIAHQIVEAIAANEAEVLKVDFYNSLLAAFTPEEIREQLKAADFDLSVTNCGDRHVLMQGFAA